MSMYNPVTKEYVDRNSEKFKDKTLLIINFGSYKVRIVEASNNKKLVLKKYNKDELLYSTSDYKEILAETNKILSKEQYLEFEKVVLEHV
ncbi:MAG: hypothetical protein K9H48_07645 [Melioribacteraceae bacterium]|nr:hypothetical protein [Melioribacteraceae bacterium]